MNDFIHIGEKHSLLYDACVWLSYMGLNETRWFLDAEWIISLYNTTYDEWIKAQ